jgi:hypothetical protein
VKSKGRRETKSKAKKSQEHPRKRRKVEESTDEEDTAIASEDDSDVSKLWCRCQRKQHIRGSKAMVGCDDPRCRVRWYHDICLTKWEQGMRLKEEQWVCQECFNRNRDPNGEGIQQGQAAEDGDPNRYEIPVPGVQETSLDLPESSPGLLALNAEVRRLEERVASGDAGAQDEIDFKTFRFHWRNAVDRLTNENADLSIGPTGLPQI